MSAVLAGQLPVLVPLALVVACSLWALPSGPAVGSPFPAFSLKDQNGQLHSLRSLLGPKGAVLLFYQCADPSPNCKAQLRELEQHREAFQKLGLGIAAVSSDSVEASKDWAAGSSAHFPLLSESKASSSPGWFVLNRRGVIVAKYFGDDGNEQYTSAGILLHEFGWSPPGPTHEVQGKQLTATIGASNLSVVPGERVALILNIELGPKMHVYAPGVEGYIPIDWKMQDLNQADVHAPVYPRPEKLYLKAIDETVPAYRGQFRLTRDITIPPDASKQFTASGSLRYQACDDRVCYIPQELHLNWIFELQPVDKLRGPSEIRPH
ncbi:MAG: redoxin domain-containing protein [Bryobacterales bacterium]|nr:redoxin domain-containing protein [Bryobacterales bacterium]